MDLGGSGKKSKKGGKHRHKHGHGHGHGHGRPPHGPDIGGYGFPAPLRGTLARVFRGAFDGSPPPGGVVWGGAAASPRNTLSTIFT